MADLSKWKPWYARIPGAVMTTVGLIGMLVFAVPILVVMLLFTGSLILVDVGLDMMRRGS